MDRLRNEPSIPGHSLPAGRGDAFCVVGIAFCESRLEDLGRLFELIPVDAGMAFIVAQQGPRLGRSYRIRKFLEAHTQMDVVDAVNGERIDPDHIYVVPGKAAAVLDGGYLVLRPRPQVGTQEFAIDRLFRSLGDNREARAIGVLLSESGVDGIQGLNHIESVGGLALGPVARSHTDTGAFDDQDPVQRDSPAPAIDEIPALLSGYAAHPYVAGRRPDSRYRAVVDRILEGIQGRRGYSFAGYDRSHLTRRIQRRMGIHSLRLWNSYARLLNQDARERNALFVDLLMGATEFFRDPDAWKYLLDEVLHPLVGQFAGSPLRVWVPGCSSGEEAYSLAIMLIEAQRKRGLRCQVQIFATDVNPDALQFARRARYPGGIVSQVPADWLAQYFDIDTQTGQHYQVRKEVRDLVVFGFHNLISDPPFCDVDLVSCRNVLSCLEPEVQQRVISNFAFAMKPGAALFIGRTETLGVQERQFRVLSKESGLYGLPSGREARVAACEQYIQTPFPCRFLRSEPVCPSGLPRRARLARHTEALLLERFAPAAVLVNASFEIQHLSGRTGVYLRPTLPAPNGDLLAMVSAALRQPLQTVLERVLAEDCATSICVRVRHGKQFMLVRISVEPAPLDGELLLLVVFEDEALPLSRVIPRATEQVLIRQLQDEMRSIRNERKAIIEQLENANRDLCAANEEMASINEDLYALNKEILHERDEANALARILSAESRQLFGRIASLQASVDKYRDLLRSSEIPALTLDESLRICGLSPDIKRICGFVDSDIGRPINEFPRTTIGAELIADVRFVLDKQSVRQRELHLSGRWYLRRCLPFRNEEGLLLGVLVSYVDVTENRISSEALSKAHSKMTKTLEERVADRTAQLRMLSAELSLAEERERQALAQNLHDDLGQVLNIIKIKLSSLDGRERRGDLRLPLRDIEALVDQANRSIRSVMTQLSPPVLHTLGLLPALDWLAEEIERTYGLPVKVYVDDLPKPLDEPVRTVLFRAVRELLINVAKHANSDLAEVNFIRDGSRITVAVTDRGQGFDYEESVSPKAGRACLGLLKIRERIKFLGGEMNVDSTKGDGSTISLTMPVLNESEDTRKH